MNDRNRDMVNAVWVRALSSRDSIPLVVSGSLFFNNNGGATARLVRS